MGVTCSTCFESTKAHEKHLSIRGTDITIFPNPVDNNSRSEEITKAKASKHIPQTNYIQIFSSSSTLLGKLIKLQALVRSFQYRMHSATVREFHKTRVDRRKEDFKSVYDFDQFDVKGWLAFYKENPNPKLQESKLRYKEIIMSTGYYFGQVDAESAPEGYGVLKEKEGKKTEGNWVKGKLNGWCRVTTSQGDCYEGLFKDNVLNGKGKKINQNGELYEGDFVNGFKQGFGVEETADQKYEGEFVRNQKEGKGTVTYKRKGKVFTGDFKNNSINGKGRLTHDTGDYYDGYFQDNQMHGLGKYVWKDGSFYEGEYVKGEKTGTGTFVWPDGRRYEGDFFKGVPHGNGILNVKGNRTYEVVFEKGKIKTKKQISI